MKRQINQGFFEKLYIGQDGSVEHAELTEQFRPPMGTGRDLVRKGPGAMVVATWDEGGISGDGTGRDHENTDRRMRSVGGVKQVCLVGDTGIEPVTSSV